MKTYEKCVICGKNTSVDKNKIISERKHYIIGCGQLCDECYKKVENKMEYNDQ